MTSEPDKSRHDFILLEYANLPALIAHWDAHFWQKSQFFFAAESVLLAGAGVTLGDTVLKAAIPAWSTILLLLAAGVFNFWICYVWSRTNRSNREFLGPLLDRARDIEFAILGDETGTFSTQHNALMLPGRRRHSSHPWENHLPSGFALVWSATLVMVASYGGHLGWAVATLACSMTALVLVERFHPQRQATRARSARTSDG